MDLAVGLDSLIGRECECERVEDSMAGRCESVRPHTRAKK